MASGCVVWIRAKKGRDYGGVRIGRGGQRYAHRLSWELERGPIPRGLNVLHRCDNPPCFNYEHLFLGTQRENLNDAYLKGRGRNGGMAKTHAPCGHPYDKIYGNGRRCCWTCKLAGDNASRRRRNGRLANG